MVLVDRQLVVREQKQDTVAGQLIGDSWPLIGGSCPGSLIGPESNCNYVTVSQCSMNNVYFKMKEPTALNEPTKTAANNSEENSYWPV